MKIQIANFKIYIVNVTEDPYVPKYTFNTEYRKKTTNPDKYYKVN